MARKFGCIEKCTNGVSVEDLNRITQNIDQTLKDPNGRKMLLRYLQHGKRNDDVKCLEFYVKCSEIVSKAESHGSPTDTPSKEFMESFEEAMDEAAGLNEISEITLALLERFSEARNAQSNPRRDVMLHVLKDAMTSASDHLRKRHTEFSIHAQKPCPKDK